MAEDKVMHPPKGTSRPGGIKQAKTSITEGPTASVGNIQPFNRGGKNPSAKRK